MTDEEFISHIQQKVQTDPVFTRAETVRLYDMAGIHMARGAAGIPEKVKFDELAVVRLVDRWNKLKLRKAEYTKRNLPKGN